MARCRGGGGGGEKEEGEKPVGLLKLAQALSLLLVFVGGIVIGLTTSSHINHYFSSQVEVLLKNNQATMSRSNDCTIVKACNDEKLDCMRMEAFVRPKYLNHEMTDEELFWRASMMPYKEEYPFDRLPKMSFMFLTRGPLPMLPLWEKFFKGHEKLFSIYVHAPPGFYLNVSQDSPFYGRQIPSQVRSL